MRTISLLYFISSLFLQVMVIFYWGDTRSLVGFEPSNYEMLFVSFFGFNFIYLGVIDFISDKDVYQGITKSSAQIMLNFSILITTLLVGNLILSGQTSVKLSSLDQKAWVFVAIYYTALSILTNSFFMRRNWM